MGRKQWVTASASTALLAMVVTGGYGWARADASSVAPNQPQIAPTPTVAPGTGITTPDNLTSMAPARTMLFRGGVGLGCTGGDVLTISKARPISLAEPAIFKMRSDIIAKPGEAGIIPGEGQPEVTKRMVPFNAEIGASEALAMAYDGLVAYASMPANTSPAGSTQLIDKAKALYRAAHSAYTAKRYEEASQQAWASNDASRAASLARRAEQRPTSVAGLTAPPALEDEAADDRALCALHRAYGTIGAAQDVQSEAGTDGPFFLNNASASYRQALSNYNAGQFAQAEARAESAAAAASAVLQLGRPGLTGEKLPDVPTPPDSVLIP